MSNLSIRVACELSALTFPLMSGNITPEHIDLDFITGRHISDMTRSMIEYAEFDASEISMSAYLTCVDSNTADLVAIPVFLNRSFRHGFIFINDNAGIDEPQDLAGKRIGVPDYRMTATLWIRGVLQHEYRVNPEEIKWFQGASEVGGRQTRLGMTAPKNIDITTISRSSNLNSMLENGEIDALFSATPPSSYDNGNVSRLFPNYKEVETDYFERTGVFPIMHTLVLQREIYEHDPWVAKDLFDAFESSRRRALEKLINESRVRIQIPWIYTLVEEVRETMGESFWTYGVEENRKTVELMVKFAFEQGLIESHLEIDQLFVS